ncbi:hypothetical protein PSTT_00608 [Puccinia striiformis]|uniref:Uncharacterized protein n=1 Tax=Puccinia striiformis TaxID=27350 RepID=A0A2S4W5Z8_9BASI|nr:hypothetical protein PSTT_00608 [Puccinia striiformis]
MEGKYHYNAFTFSGPIKPLPPISHFWLQWRTAEAEGWPDVIQLNRDKWDRRFPQLTEATHLDIASSDNEDNLAA